MGAVSTEVSAVEPPPTPIGVGRPEGRRRWPFSRKVTAGLILLAGFVVLAIVGPSIAPQNPSEITGDILQSPSSEHWVGTTQTGQDVFSQILVGARETMLVGFAAGAIATAIAVLIGLTAGYLGGAPDEALSAFTNLFLVISALPLVIVLAGYLRDSGSLAIVLVISLTAWAFGARILRAQTLTLRRRDFVVAARGTGEGTPRIVLWEILPNQLAIIATAFLLTTLFAILTQASLAFLGVGDLNTWSWGTILYWAQASEAFTTGAWWWYVPPGLLIALVGMSLTLLNFGIDEFLNPRLRTQHVRQQRRAAGRTRRGRQGTRDSRQAEPPSLVQTDSVLEIRQLSVDYGLGAEAVRAVNEVDLTLRRGEVLGLVGESGSGKSTLAHAVTRLLRPPAAIAAGEVVYFRPAGDEKAEPVDVLALDSKQLRAFRWDEIAIVFQSAMNALNPVLNVEAQLIDTLRAHRPDWSAERRRARAEELLELVRVGKDRLASYPHELSGGMRQRVMLAMALALEPEIVVMDEPTTALDVVVQREILDEVLELRKQLGFAVVFITHDFSLLLELADSIAVMYAGRIVETAGADDIYFRPAHPYTAGLLRSFPATHGPRQELTGIPGSPPDLRAAPPGCPFHPRCAFRFEPCDTERPTLALRARGGPESHRAACWLNDPEKSTTTPTELVAPLSVVSRDRG